MKKQLLVLILMLLPVIVVGQEYVPVQKGKKWGVQKDGVWTIEPNYLSITPFGNNFVVQIKDHKHPIKREWMLFSPEGKALLAENYNRIEIFSNDRAVIASNRHQCGIINSDGKFIMQFHHISWGINGKILPTDIPNVYITMEYGTFGDYIYFDISTGDSYTLKEHGEISQDATGVYYISYTESHYNSGKRLIPGTKYQYIVIGDGKPKHWTTTHGCYYFDGKFYKEKPLLANNSSSNQNKNSHQESSSSNRNSSAQTTIPKLLPNLNIVPNSIAFKDAAGTNSVEAGKSSSITFQVQNTGKGMASNCIAKMTAKGTTQDITLKDVNIAGIPAGGTKTVELPIVTGINTQDGQVEFAIQVDEPNGFGTDPHYLTVKTRAFEAPLVKITDYSLTGDAGTTLKKKQPFDLQLMLQNTKYGQADDVSVTIDIPQNVLLLDGTRQQSYAVLKGGETKSLVYSLIVNNNYQGSTIPIKVYVKEKYGNYAEDRTINLTLEQALASTKIDIEATQQQPRQDIHIASIGSDVDKEIPQTTVQQKKTFAVIIANEHYQAVESVPFANNDGSMFEAYCRQTLGIPQHNIHIAKDATLNGLKYQIDWLRQVMEAYNGEANAIFYYAGHGIPDEQSHASYLLPVDGYPNNMSSAYSMEELYHTLGNLPAQSVTVFLDACFSGTKRDGNMLSSARGVAIKAKSNTPSGKMIVFSAAQGDETAYPYIEQRHGLFTYYLLKKLKESQGNATLGDLSDYITQEVKRQSIVINSKSQTPCIMASPSFGNGWKELKLK